MNAAFVKRLYDVGKKQIQRRWIDVNGQRQAPHIGLNTKRNGRQQSDFGTASRLLRKSCHLKRKPRTHQSRTADVDYAARSPPAESLQLGGLGFEYQHSRLQPVARVGVPSCGFEVLALGTGTMSENKPHGALRE